MAACKRGDQSLLRLTVSKGCDVHAKDEVLHYYYLIYFFSVFLQLERTALYHAVTTGHEQIAMYLIRECGANVNDRDMVI